MAPAACGAPCYSFEIGLYGSGGIRCPQPAGDGRTVSCPVTSVLHLTVRLCAPTRCIQRLLCTLGYLSAGIKLGSRAVINSQAFVCKCVRVWLGEVEGVECNYAMEPLAAYLITDVNEN